MASGDSAFWKKCSNCKKEISFNTPYFRCSVSTCNHARTGLQFCSVSCWSSHVPIYRHRDAWAIEEQSPSTSSEVGVIQKSEAPERDVLVVASKLKSYIREQSEMNTSADVMDVLSDYLRKQCDEAIKRARNDGRKTVMARDF